MKKIQIFIESDIIVRHFIHNETFKSFESQYKVQYVFPKDKRVSTPIESLNLKDTKIIGVDRPRLGKMRELIKAFGLRKIKNKPEFSFLEDIWKGILPRKSFLKIKFFSHWLIFPIYKWLTLKRLGDYPELEKAITDFSPDVVLHPCVLEGLFISDLISATKKKGIPFIVLMNSWDNPSTKATVLGLPQKLVVWGDQTKQHAIKFMDMPEKDVEVFGPAQFEVYRNPPDINREDYCQKSGLNSTKILIIYAGSSKSINEIEHLQTLENAIESDELKNSHIVFKPHPWRAPAKGEPDFFDLKWKHVTMDPGMIPFYKKSVKKGDGSIQLSSYMDTHIILSACDILISNVSTILLEAALHGMPIMCMVSNKEIQENNFLRVTLNSLYFKELMTKLEVPRCNDHSTIVEECEKLIRQFKSPEFKENQINKTKYFVDMGDKPYIKKLSILIEDMLKKGAKS